MDDVLTVRRWQRYGADRLYVTHENGLPVGSVDLQSGEVVATDAVLEAQVRRAAQAYLRSDLPEMVVPAQRGASPDETEYRELAAAMVAWLGPGVDESVARASTIAERLDRLADEGWETVHDVPLGRQGTCVEHLLIGPGGLFTVTERRHPGQSVVGRGRAMTVDGRPVAYLRDARLEATRTQDRLLAAGCAQIHVRAVLVLTGELDVDVLTTPNDPLVVARHEVPGLFRRMPVVVEARGVQALAKVARRATTWLG
ncbi:MAG TPA: NERD domain-containing protein [Cellulomonas sp.]